MKATVIHDLNAGNSPTTPHRTTGRAYCIRLDTGEYARNARGQVRRFGSQFMALFAAIRDGYEVRT
jgi:hypothetical protein